MIKEKHIDCITHRESDVDFNVYYNYDTETNEADITGIYLIGSQVDLIGVIDDMVKEDLEIELEES